MATDLQTITPGGLGQGSNTAIGLSQGEMNNPAAQIALASQQAIMEMYNKSANPSAVTFNGASVKTLDIDARTMQNVENNYIQADVINASDSDRLLIIGSVLGLQGAFAFYAAAASACDDPGISDQNGANIRFIQGYSQLVNLSPVIIDTLQMVSDDAIQRAQPFLYNALAYDNTQCRVTNNTTSTFTRFDNNDTVIKLRGLWYLGPQNFVSVISKAGESMNLIVAHTAIGSIRTFRQA